MESKADEKIVETTVKSIVSTRSKISKLIGELYERISKLEIEQLKLSLADSETLPTREEQVSEETVSPPQFEIEDLSRHIADLEEELMDIRKIPQSVKDVWEQPLDLAEVLYVPHTMRNVDLDLEF